MVGTAALIHRWECRPGCDVYSGLMLAALITLAHFSVSPTKCFSNSDGGPLSTLPPRSVIRALSVGSASPALISLLRRSTTSLGVFFGAPTPNHTAAS